MRELIDERQANLLMVALAVGLPLVGVLIGAILGSRRGRLAAGLGAGLAAGSIGIANWVLWRVYNAITDRLGLDTVRNLWVNLALFVAVGVLAGVLLGLRARKENGNG